MARAGPPALAAPATPLLGLNVNRLLLDRTYSPAQIDAQLSALARTGARDARTDALWEAAEPAAPIGGVHHYDWAFSDRIASALARHGLRWLPIIDYTAGWAQSIPGQDHSPPRSASSYAAYAGAFAARYGPGGSFWAEHPMIAPRPVTTYEIWNEPDGGHFWLPGPQPGRYAIVVCSRALGDQGGRPGGAGADRGPDAIRRCSCPPCWPPSRSCAGTSTAWQSIRTARRRWPSSPR